MSDITNLHSSQYTVLVNNTNSVYSKTFDNVTITINVASGSVDNTSVEKETNFNIAGVDIASIVSSKLVLTYANVSAESIIGFRISTSNVYATKADYTFTTSDNTTFTVPGELPNIADASADPNADTVIWQQAGATHGVTGDIPIEINYKGSALPTENPLAINVDFFIMATAGDYSNATKVTVSQDDSDPTPNNLEVLVVSAEVTSTLTASYPATLGTSVTAFNINDTISFNDVFTVNSSTNYKPVNVFNFEESLNKAITLNYLYISTEPAASIDTTQNKLMDGTSPDPVELTNYTSIDISAGTATGVTIEDDAEQSGNNKITVNMATITDTAKFFEDSKLKSPLYVYIQGKISSDAQS